MPPSPGARRFLPAFLLPAAILLLLAWTPSTTLALRTFSPARIASLRREVHAMFQHAYQGYLDHASDYDELRPLSCDGINTWGSYSLTLIDALDTLAVLGNHTEFARVTRLLESRVSAAFDADLNVSVFETNIRIVGGLLGAHLLSHRAGVPLEPGWPCNGPLLRMAEDVAARLLPAFDTRTGMPYGTVNLRNGVPPGETSVTCTAGVGTFVVEFGALSRLTGKPIYEEVALQALHALQKHRSAIGLFGNHIDVQTGRWTAQDAGIGSGVDSFYEYLVKGAVMLGRPELLAMFAENKRAVDRYLRRDDWHVWVGMTKGQVTLPVFQSLEAYWPGVLSLFGDTNAAMRALHNYHAVWRQYGFLPEFYNIPAAEAGANRENYPLRPELVESVWYLWKATGDEWLLQVGEDVLRSLQHSARTACGYATIKNVRDHSTEDRMESFFLAETTKYLYLLFDPDNPLNNDGGHGTVIQTPRGQCLIAAGGYVFNTEAHPIDVGALRCCHDDHSNLLSGYFGDDEPRETSERLRGEAFDRQSSKAAAHHQSSQTIPESAAQLNANALPEPEPWQRKGGVTMATIDLASVRASLGERDRLVAEIMGVLNSGEKPPVEATADADVGVGEVSVVAEAEEEHVDLEQTDDSLIVSDDDETNLEMTSTENGTEAEAAESEQFVQVNDDLIRSIPENAEEEQLMADAPVEVVKLTPPSRDADDNRSSSSSTISPSSAMAKDSPETSSSSSADDEFLVFDESNNEVDGSDGAPPQQQQQHFDQESYLRDTQQQEMSSAGANGSGAVVGVISDFVQSVLRAKLPAAATFDADAMLDRLRRQQRESEAEGQGDGGRLQQDFRLLTCRAQPFLQRLSVMGEFF